MLVWQANAPYWDARICAVVRGRMLAWLITSECPVSAMPTDARGSAAGCLPGRRMPLTGMPKDARGGAAGRRMPLTGMPGSAQWYAAGRLPGSSQVNAPYLGCPKMHVVVQLAGECPLLGCPDLRSGMRPDACLAHHR